MLLSSGGYRSLEAHSPRCILLLVAVVALSYGAVWERGLYADDFPLFVFARGQSLWQAVPEWWSGFNSRISQGHTLPLFFGLAGAGENALDGSWWVPHALTLVALLVCLWLLDRILETSGVPAPARLVCLLVFALHPVKVQAQLWLAGAVGYLFPLTAFLFATSLYLEAAAGRRAAWRLLLIVLGWAYALFGIEQIITWLPLVILLRHLRFPSTGRQKLADVLLFAALVGVFAAVTFSGATSDRVAEHAGPGLHAGLVAERLRLFADLLLLLPARLALDGFYWSRYFPGWPALVLGVLAVIAIHACAARAVARASHLPRAGAGWLVLAGLLVLLAPITPFFVIGYYVPERAAFLPSLGLGLVAGAVAWVLAGRWPAASHPLGALIAIASGFCLLGNLFCQVEYRDTWTANRSLMEGMALQDPSPGAAHRFIVLGIPRTFAQAPAVGMADWWPTGVAQSVLPGSEVEGYATLDAMAVLSFDGAEDHDPAGRGNTTVYFYAGGRYVEAPPLRRIGCGDSGADRLLEPPAQVAEVCVVAIWRQYASGARLGARSFILLPGLNLGLLHVDVRPPQPGRRPMLVAHVQYADGTVLPYDTVTSEEAGFRYDENGSAPRTLVLQDARDIREIRLALQGVHRQPGEMPLQRQLTVGGSAIRVSID